MLYKSKKVLVTKYAPQCLYSICEYNKGLISRYSVVKMLFSQEKSPPINFDSLACLFYNT